MVTLAGLYFALTGKSRSSASADASPSIWQNARVMPVISPELSGANLSLRF